MAFNHVGGCDCPVGCCDCGPPSPERDLAFLLRQYPSDLRAYSYDKESHPEFDKVLKALNKTAFVLKSLGSEFKMAYDAIKKRRKLVREILKDKIKSHKEYEHREYKRQQREKEQIKQRGLSVRGRRR